MNRIKIGNREFDINNNVYIMGILNVTPDSFSDGGNFNNMDSALRHVSQMLEEGADIIDVGGESSRPGYTHISVAEEIERVTPVIEKIKSEFNTVISIDTYHADCAEAALEAGADLVNDIWGLKADDRMAQVVAKSGAAVCLMHNRQVSEYPEGFIPGVIADIQASIDIALAGGVARDRIVLDPGIGFAKSYEQNLIMLKHLNELNRFELPCLLGTSRKSVIGNALNLPVSEREEGTMATSIWGMINGYSFVRVHDVKKNKRALDMMKAIMDA